MLRNLLNRFVLIIIAASLIFSCGKKEKDSSVAQQELPSVVIEAFVDKVQATTGDIILYSIDISSVPGLKVSVPEVGERIAGFRIIDWGEERPKQIDDRIRLNKWYKLRADIIGSYIIPSFRVSYLDADGSEKALETSEVFIQVKSSIGEDEEFKDIIDIKPLVDIKVEYRGISLISVIFGIFVISSALLLVALKVSMTKKHEPPLPPHEVAFNELDKLRYSRLLKEMKIKEFYFKLSEIVRSYMESRFLFNASEWTTEEILPVVKKDLGLDYVLRELIESFLRNTDLVKFTNFIPSNEKIQLELSMAYKVVEQTIEKKEECEYIV